MHKHFTLRGKFMDKIRNVDSLGYSVNLALWFAPLSHISHQSVERVAGTKYALESLNKIPAWLPCGQFCC